MVAWWISWSCDLDYLYKLLFPLVTEVPHIIDRSSGFRRKIKNIKMSSLRSSKNIQQKDGILENCVRRQTTTDGGIDILKAQMI